MQVQHKILTTILDTVLKCAMFYLTVLNGVKIKLGQSLYKLKTGYWYTSEWRIKKKALYDFVYTCARMIL